MIARDQGFRDAVEAAVERIEQTSDAEIVVVAAARSGSYRDTALVFGLIVGALALAFVIYSPWTFGPATLPLELALAIGLAAFGASRCPPLLRLLTTAKRRARQVENAAAAAFLEERVHGTRHRTGVLVYLSALERCAVAIADHGIEARVPPADWRRIPLDGHTLDGFLRSMDALGALLAEHVPPTDENPNELPNAPRILS